MKDDSLEIKHIYFDERFLKRDAGGLTTDSLNLAKFLRNIAPSKFKIQKSRNSLLRFNLKSVFWQQQLTVPPFVFGKKIFVRVHDIFPITNPEWFGLRARIAFRIAFLYYRSIKATFVTNSYYTEGELKSLTTNSKIITLWCEPRDVETSPCNTCSACIFLNNYDFTKLLLIAVGTIEPRKDYEKLYALQNLLGKIEPEYQIVVLGRYGWKQKRTYERLKLNIILLENSCDGSIGKLIKTNSIYISTSFKEGFGLPALEWRLKGKYIILPRIDVYSEIHNTYSKAIFYNDIAEIPEMLRIMSNLDLSPQIDSNSNSLFQMKIDSQKLLLKEEFDHYANLS